MTSFAYFNAGTRAAVYARATVGAGLRAFATYQRTIVAVGGATTQRIEGGSQMYKKNTAAKFSFKAVDSNGAGVTGLTITAKTAKDGAAPAPTSNSVIESGSGWYWITLTSTEMNGDMIVLDPSATGVSIAPITISTESDYTAARAAFLTGDAFARLGAPAGASISADIANIAVATNAGDLATKQADSATLTTGSNTSGSYASTASNDLVYWITAPVTPAVGGFGLRQQIVFDLPIGRTPVGIQVRGYFNGSGQTVDIYALNSRTGAYDKLTNSSTNLASRNSDSLYSIPLPRDYAEDSGGSFNIVTLEFRSASTNTAHRLRLDQVLIAHVAEDVAVTSTAPTAQQIWNYSTRELTTPGVEPTVAPSAAEIRAEIDANSTQLAAVKGKTDNLPSDPADASDIAGAFGTVNSTLATIAGDIPTAAAIADAVWDEAIAGHVVVGSTGEALTDAGTGGSAPTASDIADEVQTRTLNANIQKVNDIAIGGSGTPGAPWGP